MDEFKSLKEKIKLRSDGDAKLIYDLIQTIEQQQKEIDYFLMKYDNTGAVMNRQAMRSKIEEQAEEIERLKEELGRYASDTNDMELIRILSKFQ